MKRLLLEEMIWPEVAAEMENIKIAVVPVGSCEQHGPNTTYATDTARSYEFCKLLAERVGNKIIVVPPVTIGVSAHHMCFPGTVTLRVETMINVIADIAIALNKQGFKKILFVNGHGGNIVPLEAAITKLKYEYNIDAYYSGMGTPISKAIITPDMGISPINGHACEMETSQSMYLCPWIVREKRYAGELQLDGPFCKRIFKDGGAAWNWKKHASENGALGDARKASRELGERLTNYVLDYMEKLLDEIIAM